ncbi:hypothetical protein NA56DRAFT_652392 [Hyaloscypha hepaticicola]|uniref:Uncharacterized protein n=1 Tax=Hyaloscypha hepaticicola TaxID=2082293 RepID=A0A2J6PF09_9HELO|nr:hypothetical protein NA56DRAFT_652392 [Hyaloscypha hepaticicola]
MASQGSSTSDVCLYFLAIFLPPLAVFFKRGCNADFLINILLSILGWIPGVIRMIPFPHPPSIPFYQLSHKSLFEARS